MLREDESFDRGHWGLLEYNREAHPLALHVDDIEGVEAEEADDRPECDQLRPVQTITSGRIVRAVGCGHREASYAPLLSTSGV